MFVKGQFGQLAGLGQDGQVVGGGHVGQVVGVQGGYDKLI